MNTEVYYYARLKSNPNAWQSPDCGDPEFAYEMLVARAQSQGMLPTAYEVVKRVVKTETTIYTMPMTRAILWTEGEPE